MNNMSRPPRPNPVPGFPASPAFPTLMSQPPYTNPGPSSQARPAPATQEGWVERPDLTSQLRNDDRLLGMEMKLDSIERRLCQLEKIEPPDFTSGLRTHDRLLGAEMRLDSMERRLSQLEKSANAGTRR